jgi:hypothetical protein
MLQLASSVIRNAKSKGSTKGGQKDAMVVDETRLMLVARMPQGTTTTLSKE